MKPIVVSEQLWRDTWEGLRLRGGGVREAACVWGGIRSLTVDKAVTVTFLDDLPGVRAGARYHQLSRATINALFDVLRKNGDMIVVDIHTHPGPWCGLSLTDAASPIEFRPGLPAMVLPYYAKPSPSVDAIGLHEYVGDGEWNELSQDEIFSVLKIGG
jgi:hypothetical protein